MSPTRTSKSPTPATSPISAEHINQQIFGQCTDPAFIAAVNRAANVKCLLAIHSGRLRLASPYKFPEPTKYIPRMDLIDDPSSPYYSAVFEIPGIRKETISINIRSGKLYISGRRRAPYPMPAKQESAEDKLVKPEPPADYPMLDATRRDMRVLVHELRYGNFERYVDIPAGLKESDIRASLMDGLLTVTWPKTSPHPVAPAPAPAPRVIKKSKSSSPSSHPQALLAAGTASQ